jgi:hypothetical protein
VVHPKGQSRQLVVTKGIARDDNPLKRGRDVTSGKYQGLYKPVGYKRIFERISGKAT